MVVTQAKNDNPVCDAAIRIRSVRKAFVARSVLQGVDLDVAPAQAVCLCGPNGVGKSTLLRIIAGLLGADDGSVAVNGYDLLASPDKAKAQLGLISHGSMVYSDLTVAENLLFAAGLYSVVDRAGRIEQLLAHIGLAPYKHDRAAILSRGLLQRLAIVRALVHKPRVLLADEPFTGLDTEASQRLVDIFGDFVRGGGSIVMATHDVGMAVRCCDRAVVLDEGRVRFDAMMHQIDSESFARDYMSYVRSNS